MNFSQHLLEFLKKQGSAAVPNFGTFFLKSTSATLDESGKNILPPGKEIAFEADSTGERSDFVPYLSAHQKISLLEAEIEIRKQVTFWNSKLEKDGTLAIENFGTFFLNDSKLHFKGDKAENVSADFYGLEQINLAEIKSGKNIRGEKSFQFSKTVYWITPVLIGIGALAYFAITQPEQLFGMASFPNNFKEKPKAKIQNTPVQQDSVRLISPHADSLRLDSLKNANSPQSTPKKKWSSKK